MQGVDLPELSIIVPVYKEAENIQPFLERTVNVMTALGLSYEIIFCLDPSPDHTEEVIVNAIEKNAHIKLLVFSRRFGQPAATMAGISFCKGKMCVVIDVDLQDPPELIGEMHAKMLQGFDVVYAKRRSRKGETWFKKCIASLGYRLINQCSDIHIPRDAGDFRLMSRRTVQALRSLNETHGFLRGLITYVGFKQTYVEYDRDARYAGKGNYNRFTGSLKIGLNGLISFSSKPLQFISVSGGVLIMTCLLLSGLHVMSSIVGAIGFFAGVQLLFLGLMGEYVGRIYDEVKRRPMFILDHVVDRSVSQVMRRDVGVMVD